MLGQHPVINPIASGNMLHMRLCEGLILTPILHTQRITYLHHTRIMTHIR
jgi:hypothetical protein